MVEPTLSENYKQTPGLKFGSPKQSDDALYGFIESIVRERNNCGVLLNNPSKSAWYAKISQKLEHLAAQRH